MGKYILFKYTEESTTLQVITCFETLDDAILAYLNLQTEHLLFLFDSETHKVMSDDLIEYIYKQTIHGLIDSADESTQH